VHAASSRLHERDLPVLAMLVGRHSVQEIALALRLTPEQVRAQALRIIGRLQAAHRLPA
jgi:DNA-binding CsgD family transcriptional regulator